MSYSKDSFNHKDSKQIFAGTSIGKNHEQLAGMLHWQIVGCSLLLQRISASDGDGNFLWIILYPEE